MKKTGRIELIKNIRKTMVSFISIAIFVALGIGMFLGITWSADAFSNTVSKSSNSGKMHDIEITFEELKSAEQLDKLKNIDGVDEIEGKNIFYEFFDYGGQTYQAKVNSITYKIDVCFQTEGRLPEAENEIAVEKFWAKQHGLKIGDELTIQSLCTKTDKFKVTALVENASYLCSYQDTYGVSPTGSIPVNVIMFLPETAFNQSIFNGYFSAFIRSYGLDVYDMYGDEYEEAVKVVEKRIKEYTDILGADYKNVTALKTVNASVVASSYLMDIFGELRYSMAALFMIVGLLVCFFSVSRLVYEQKTLIGTKKSLGFSRREITESYLLYSFMAAVVGIIIGFIIARFIIEPMLMVTLGEVYLFEKIIYFVEVKSFALLSLIEIALQVLTAYLACRKILKKSALSLLTGNEEIKVKTRFYERGRLWKKLPLYVKTMINNCFSDKRRVLSTVVGIMGCTALVVTAFTLNNSILGSFKKQYKDILFFDSVVYYQEEDNTLNDIKGVLDGNDIKNCEMYSTYCILNAPNGKHIATSIFVYGDDGFFDLFKINGIDGKNSGKVKGLWSSCSYQNEFKAKEGDKISITALNGKDYDVKANGYFEYYLIQNQLVMDKDTFSETFGESYKPNTVMISTKGIDVEQLKEDLSGVNGYLFLEDYYKNTELSFNAFASVFSIVVFVYVILSVVMGILVVLNLLTMFIEEKKKEVIVLMINGYGRKEARRYISVDTVFLTVIGIIVGVIFGVVIGNLSLNAYNNETIFFMSGIDLTALIIGVVFTAVLVFIIAKIALKRIDKFKLSDINNNK